MLPTYKPGQEVLSFNWAYLFKQPKVGEVVVLQQNGKKMIKRIKQMKPNGEIYVLGDNETASTDSRSFGWIKPTQIQGKVITSSAG